MADHLECFCSFPPAITPTFKAVKVCNMIFSLCAIFASYTPPHTNPPSTTPIHHPPVQRQGPSNRGAARKDPATVPGGRGEYWIASDREVLHSLHRQAPQTSVELSGVRAVTESLKETGFTTSEALRATSSMIDPVLNAANHGNEEELAKE